MRKGKLGLLALMLAAGMGLLSGCGQVDETVLNSEADTTVNIAVPYATATPLPEYLDVPDPVVIDSNGNVTVNDSTLLTSHLLADEKESDSAYRTLSLGDTGLAVQSLQHAAFGAGVLHRRRVRHLTTRPRRRRCKPL